MLFVNILMDLSMILLRISVQSRAARGIYTSRGLKLAAYKEALEVLYRTNIFVIERGYRHPFSDIKDFGTALCISYDIYRYLVCCWLLGPGIATYYAFFRLVKKSFRGVLRLYMLL
ncbi:hypothetical protein N7467_007158 [Penicillium canescens]|nr:hypothetical protein N7467_007158 [Penicillium canescens]